MMHTLKHSTNVQYASINALPAAPTKERGHEKLDLVIDAIASKGCIAVNQLLYGLKKNNIPEQLQGYSASERNFIYQELKAVMAVYGNGVCCL